MPGIAVSIASVGCESRAITSTPVVISTTQAAVTLALIGCPAEVFRNEGSQLVVGADVSTVKRTARRPG